MNIEPDSLARLAGRLEALADLVEPLESRSEAVEEKISLSERFGLWLSIHPFNQEDYVAIVRHWVGALDGVGNGRDGGGDTRWERVRARALQWALNRGSRRGRSAYRFARDRVGRRALGGTA